MVRFVTGTKPIEFPVDLGSHSIFAPVHSGLAPSIKLRSAKSASKNRKYRPLSLPDLLVRRITYHDHIVETPVRKPFKTLPLIFFCTKLV